MTELTLVLVATTTTFALLFFFARMDLSATRKMLDSALDAANRADDRSELLQKAYNDMVARPVQAFLPHDAIETIGGHVAEHVIEYLSVTEKK